MYGVGQGMLVCTCVLECECVIHAVCRFVAHITWWLSQL